MSSAPRHLTAASEVAPLPAECRTMADVREGVDAVDRALVALLARRQGYMEAAARIKDSRAAVRDNARIEDVVAKVLAAAYAAGLSADIAEPVWRTLIERCIAHEFTHWDKIRTGRDTPEASTKTA